MGRFYIEYSLLRVAMTKEDNDNLARQVYLEAKCYMSSDTTDVIAKRKIPAEKIKSDMALFKKIVIESNTTLTYYYNRIEIRTGNQLNVLPFSVAIGK